MKRNNLNKKIHRYFRRLRNDLEMFKLGTKHIPVDLGGKC